MVCEFLFTLLVAYAGLLSAVKPDLCLNGVYSNSSDFVDGSNSLEYLDGTFDFVKIPYPSWTSARVMAQISYILLSEVMGYSSVLVDTHSMTSENIVNYVAGCQDPYDSSCAVYNLNNPAVHFTLETWPKGTNRIASLPDSIRPVLLNVMDYEIEDRWFLWQDVVDEGFNSPSQLSLDFYRTYPATGQKVSKFFDPWTRIFDLVPSSVVVKCPIDLNSSSPLLDDSAETSDASYANETCVPGDAVWFAPSCRSNTSACVPLILRAGLGSAIRIAAEHGLPLAIVVIGAGANGTYSEYAAAARAGRFLFAWRLPDDTLVDSGGRLPVALRMPTAHGDAPALPSWEPRNYAWPLLAATDTLVARLAARVSLRAGEMRDLMLRSRRLPRARPLCCNALGLRIRWR